MMIATMPLRPRAPLTLGHAARSRRETAMRTPDHTAQLHTLLDALKDVGIAMDAPRWADIPSHAATDRTRDFMGTLCSLVECLPDPIVAGHLRTRQAELVGMSRTALRILDDPIPEVQPALCVIREALADMGEVVR